MIIEFSTQDFSNLKKYMYLDVSRIAFFVVLYFFTFMA